MHQINDTKINYLSSNYLDIKSSLVEYSKSYFPNSFNDFTPASPTGFFIGLVSYVGDLLSYYIDKRYQESIMQHATDRKSVVDLASFLGYNHKSTTASSVDLSVYQLIPKHATLNEPDYTYALKINEGMLVKANNGIVFRTLESVDFSITGSIDTEINSYDTTYQNTSYFVIKKNVRAASASTEVQSFSFTDTDAFATIELAKTNILSILNCVDTDGNIWYEVPYLSQDTIATSIANTALTNNLYTNFSDSTPFLIEYKKTPKRFIKRINENDKMRLIFGAGTLNIHNEDIIPTQAALSQLYDDSSIADRTIDTRNFLRLDSLGEAPRNTTLTVTYLYGGGVESNVQSNELTNILSSTTSFKGKNLDLDRRTFILNSIRTNNLVASIGGRGTESTEEIKQNALSYFASQNRVVTKEDYEIRVLSMDPKFGSIEKVYAVKDTDDPTTPEIESNSISLYCSAKNADRTLTVLNNATKYNLKKYLNQYRLLTDNINIRDAFIINIGVDFSIQVNPSFNSQAVLFECLAQLKDFFSIEKWNIGTPIIKSDIQNLLYNINGVRSVGTIEIKNKRGGGYSNIYYNIENATRNEIVYSSLDPAIFEVKFPNSDIQGMVV